MSLLDAFPEDPFQPTLRYAARIQVPISVPWSNETVALGTTFSISPTNGQCSLSRHPFCEKSLRQSTLLFTAGSQGSLDMANGSDSSRSLQHVTFSVAGQIGFSWAGASGRAKYEKDAKQDSSNVQSSLRCNFRGGVITLREAPELSRAALSLLRTSAEPHVAFREQFGDYYVGAYVLGGANATKLSGSTASGSSTEDLSAQIEAHLLWVSTTKHIEKHEQSSHFAGKASIQSFDTLDIRQDSRSGDDQATWMQITQSAAENQIRGKILPKRVAERAQQLGLTDGTKLSWAKCEEICSKGLVMEIILMPFSGLRDYVAAVLSPQV